MGVIADAREEGLREGVPQRREGCPMHNPPVPPVQKCEVELSGGPHDGRRVMATGRAAALLFHDVEPAGALAAYRRTTLFTPEGLGVYRWSGTAPPKNR